MVKKKNVLGRRLLTGRRSWLAMGTLAACAACGANDRALAAGAKKDGRGGAGEQASVANLAVKQFNIPAGPLDTGFAEFERQTGVKISSSLTQAAIAGFQTKGVSGQHSIAEGMRLLLEGTGLQDGARDAGTVVVGLRNSETVEVNASINAIPLTQFTEPLVDTAQTVNVVPQFILQDQQVTTLRDTLRNVPGISIAAGEGGAQGDNLTIRGFTARNDVFLDGIRDFGSYYRDSFNFESVAVLQGPAGVEFGRGSTGGVVNQETKLPLLQEHVGGSMQLGTNLMRRVAVDVNEPIKALEGGAFRVNIVGSESNVAGRDYTNVRRFGIAPSLALGLNGHTRLFMNYLHEGENDLPDYGLPYFGAGPLNVPRSNFYGYAESNYFRTNPDVITGRVEHDFGQHFVLRNALRWANYSRDVMITEPQINTTPVYSVVSGVVYGTCSPTAATPCFPVTTPINQLSVRRNQIAVNSVEDMLWNQTSGTGHFSFLHIDNDYSLILEGGRERSRPQRPTYPSTIYTNALNPNALELIPAATAVGVKTYVNSQSAGLGFNDTLKLRSWLMLSGGIRFDYFNADYVGGAVHLSRLDKKPNYRAAVVVKPQLNGSIYFDWGTSFNPSAESLSLSATNAVQAPQYNENYEAGAKWTFLRDRLNVNGSCFQTTKTNVYETDPTNTANVIPVGNQRVRGVQLGGLGRLPGQFDLIFGYAYLNGIATSSEQNYSPFAAYFKTGDPVFGAFPYYLSAKGNPFANVPKNSANLFVTHAIAWRFVGGFGFNQISARRASSTGPIALPQSSAATPVSAIPMAYKVIPGYWTLNAMVRRPISDHVDFQANINNLTNRFFIDQPHPNHLIPSEAISAQFGFNYKF